MTKRFHSGYPGGDKQPNKMSGATEQKQNCYSHYYNCIHLQIAEMLTTMSPLPLPKAPCTKETGKGLWTNGHTFQGNIGCAKIPMFTISHISQMEALIRELVDEKSLQLTSQALPRDSEIKEICLLHSFL